MARAALRDDLYTAHAAHGQGRAHGDRPGQPGGAARRLGGGATSSAVRRAGQTLTEIWESDWFTVATLSVAVRAIRTLVRRPAPCLNVREAALSVDQATPLAGERPFECPRSRRLSRMAVPIPQMKSRNCRRRSPAWRPSSTLTPCAREADSLQASGGRPTALGRPGAGAGGHPPAVLPRGGPGPAGRPALPARRHRVMFELAESEHDEPTREEATRDLAALRKEIDQLEIRTLLSGEYDAREALISDQRAGRRGGRGRLGGGAAADLPALGRAARVRDARSTTPPTRKRRASSRPRSRSRRRTRTGRCAASTARTGWCASPSTTTRAAGRPPSPVVDVIPVVEQADHIEIPDDEIRVDVFRSSGPGGQGVNTTDSAVRITHLPTGIVVSCQNERSQIQNRATAMAVLQAKLLERKREEQAAKMAELRGDARAELGHPDPQLCAAPVPEHQGPADRATRRATPRPSWTARSTTSSRPRSAGSGPRGSSRRNSPEPDISRAPRVRAAVIACPAVRGPGGPES